MKNMGLKTEADSERLYASLLEAKDLLATSLNEGRKFIHLLRVLTGIIEDNITIEDDFTERSRTILPSFTDAQWHKMLTNNNAELKALSSKIKQSQSLYESSKTEHYGTVISVGSVGNDTSLSSYSSNQIGIKASVPLFTGGRLSHQIEKDRVAILLAKEALHSREYTLWQELYESILDTNRLDNTIEAKKMAARALGKTVTITEGRYKEGLSTYIEVLEAQRAYDNARISQNAAMLQKIASMAHIQRLIPQGVTHDIHD
jgi:outer membrane protein TolC